MHLLFHSGRRSSKPVLPGQGSLLPEGWHKARAGLPINEGPREVTANELAALLRVMKAINPPGPTSNVALPAFPPPLWSLSHQHHLAVNSIPSEAAD